MHAPFRAALAALLTLLLSAVALVGATTPAQAADVYRYWAYFTVTDGEFVAQETGPSGAKPADGDVEAYRFAAPADYTQPNLPRADLSEVDFETVCGDKTAESGDKRVAVLLDYGVEEDADGAEVPEPEALCAVVPAKANGLQTLEAVAPDLRTQKSSFGPLVCGISGYPETGCADEKVAEGTPADAGTVEFAVASDETGDESGEAGESGSSDSSDTSAASESDEGSNALLLAGIAVLVVLVVAGGVLLNRRRTTA
ncbi:SCO2322 family protein [Nocardioides donggukensis]|uniref:LPXTG cell wall anchor domain-containing protein n=1 Tax=Nocardioides donggukensis TaxID=2774019 RepID=A0A927K4Y9_9ACTN|nr:SCO2322 family protein [Nocardioides donggukensis]MBD8869853.1 hypothetical protein [Nocardioides donggukensis]